VKSKNEIGNRYGRLLVIERSDNTKQGRAQWKCLCDCGNKIISLGSNLRNGHTASCGCQRRETTSHRCSSMTMEKNPAWKGGCRITSQGYVKVMVPNHPEADCDGYVYQHRLVVEGELGEHLNQDHVVHHINGNRSDNRFENLMLFPDQASHTAFHHVQRRKAVNG
jgi:hypothetical protein